MRPSHIALVSLAVLACGCAGGGGPTIGASPPDAPRTLTVSGLDARSLEAFDGLEPDKRQSAVQVRVADAPSDAPALLGDVQRRGGELVFTRRYPFQPGLKYRGRFDPAALGVAGAPVVMEFTVPAPPSEPVVRVAAIYPSADELPENLLKFYIHFTGPMSRGEAYTRVRLLDEAGETVPWPFLELEEELWNPEMTRFTLFFEPGRIKQGLAPRLEMGSALVNGKTYTLVVDNAWQDGERRPLVAAARKSFRVGPADKGQPHPSRWHLIPPAPQATEPVVIDFDEPLDHAMLQRVISVQDEGGRPIAGKVIIGQQERRWSFTPSQPWRPRRYAIIVETTLEDAAGNSIGRAFEVELKRGGTPEVPAVVQVPFHVVERK